MNAFPHPFGLTASLAGTLGQLAVIVATAPAVQECVWSACFHGGDPELVELTVGWEPYIDNLGTGVDSPKERRCPGRQADGSRFRLDYAPLPAGFNVHGYPDSDVLACVKLDSKGSVQAVRIAAGTGRGGVDRRLLRLIHRQWRFRPVGDDERSQTWQRVRLSSGYGSGDEPQVLPLSL